MTISNMSELTREFQARALALDLKTQVVSSGAFNAQVAIIGEAPGEREVATGMPFMGGSGQLLWDALKRINLKRSDVYATNLVKRQLEMGRDENATREKHNPKKFVGKHELSNWRNMLRWELSTLPNLKYIIILGDMALEALTGESGITNWRGSVLPVDLLEGRQAISIVTFNPAYPLREPKLEIVFRFDIGRAGRVIKKGYVRPKINAILNPSPTEAIAWIDKMQDEKLPTSLDIEVITNETACIGLGNDTSTGMCISLRNLRSNRFSAAEERTIYQRLQRFLSDPTTRIVAQNGSFDSYFLWAKDRLKIERVWFDTLLAHHALYPTLPHNLGFLTSQYTEHPFYKDEKDRWREGGNIDEFWEYNVKDVCITLQVQQRLLKELQDAKLDKFFFDHIMHAQPHLVRMTVGGLLTDRALKEKIAEELTEQVSLLITQFHEAVQAATGEPDYRPSPRSSPQLRDLLFGKLKLVGRGLSTDKLNRKRMLEHPRTQEPAKRILRILDTFKKEDKFLGTYAEMRIDDDDRIRCDWKQYGVQSAPGRLSSSAVMWGSGTNLQNQPERAKSMFIADKDYVFIYFDLAQAEARYVGWEADIPKWKEQFERARLNPGAFDAHIALASDLWKIPYDQVPKKDWYAPDPSKPDHLEPTLRYKAKRTRHGANYRMEAPKLAEVTGLSLAEATDAWQRYHKETPELRKWWEREEKEVRATKMQFNAFGRRNLILERITEESLESIIAFKPQSSIGDKVTQVIYQAHEDEAWPRRARIALNVHDAVVGLAHKDDAKRALAICVRYAEMPIMVRGEPMIIPADPKISVPGEDGVHRWSTLKGVTL